MATRRFVTPLVALCLAAAPLFPSPSTAQPSAAARATPDTAALRQALAQTLGEDFQIVRHELSSGLTERGGVFWLVHARPMRSGSFHLQYRYEWIDRVRPRDPLYTHIKHESYIRVGERGCWRRREAKEVCLGDTIILPFVLNDYRGHTFTLAYRGPNTVMPTTPLPLPRNLVAATAEVHNPAAPQLEYLGSHASVMLHRVLGSTTVNRAEFEAVAPGRFNLAVRRHWPGQPPMPGSPGRSVPVIVVPRGQPVTVLLASEQVTSVHETGNFASHTGSQYLTTPLLLQPGDRISLEFSQLTVRGRDPTPAEREAATPVITRLPFHLDTTVRFNAWIADYLPRRR
ncbi:MAG TPA: hypothetical protein VEX86_02380 [Longimicrobium sp.]|nr:hypothetical protein [Longimicrobium sp.]